MANSKSPIQNLATLDKRIRVLQMKAKVLEQQIDENFEYLQDHSGTLFVNSILPRKTGEQMNTEGFSLGGTILYTLLQNEQLRKNLGRITSKLAERLGNILNKLVDKLFRE